MGWGGCFARAANAESHERDHSPATIKAKSAIGCGRGSNHDRRRKRRYRKNHRKQKENGETPSEKRDRQKGKVGKKAAVKTTGRRPYPRTSLEQAVRIPLAIRNGGNPWPPAEVAAAVGMSGPRDRQSDLDEHKNSTRIAARSYS
jgi:hypothetical protein